MTVHIAIEYRSTLSVLLSDSQSSSKTEEFHGFHKQFVGENFAVGAAGHSGIITSLFEALNDKIGPRIPQTAGEICSTIEQYFENEVRQKYWDDVEILVLAPDPATRTVRLLTPGVFSRFTKAQEFASAGSGSESVRQAVKRHEHLGIRLPTETLADLLITAVYYASVANECLTVDDMLTVAVIADGRSYLLGDSEIHVRYAPQQLLKSWKDASIHWEEIYAMVEQINSEIRQAQRYFNEIRTGNLIPPTFKVIAKSDETIGKLRQQLSAKIADFRNWYDNLIGRSLRDSDVGSIEL